jgi:hypothetical protein
VIIVARRVINHGADAEAKDSIKRLFRSLGIDELLHAPRAHTRKNLNIPWKDL